MCDNLIKCVALGMARDVHCIKTSLLLKMRHDQFKHNSGTSSESGEQAFIGV